MKKPMGSTGTSMNEKFFDLPKEKQDRILGAAMQVFAGTGYAQAGTDQMVKLARISKGLLFHYFISKKGLYRFLYDYAARFALLELNRNVNQEDTDFVSVWTGIQKGWRSAMRQYPYIRFFLHTADIEKDAEALSEIAERRNAYRESLQGFTARIDVSFFGTQQMLQEANQIMEYSAQALMNELDFEDDKWQDTYFARMQTCLEFIGHYSNVRKEEDRNE